MEIGSVPRILPIFSQLNYARIFGTFPRRPETGLSRPHCTVWIWSAETSPP